MPLTKASYSLIAGAPVNVLDFGAVGDGVANDTAAIQAAINQAAITGQSVFVPAGRYSITQLTLPQQQGGIEIFGEAYNSPYNFQTNVYRGSVLISTVSSGNIISCDGGAFYSNRGIRIRDLNIKVSTSGYAIWLNGSPECTEISNCSVYNANPSGGSGIGLVNCWLGALLKQCIIHNAVNGSFNSKGILLSNDIKAGSVIVDGCDVNGFYQNLYVGDQIYAVSVRSSSFENGTWGAWIDGSNSSVYMQSCHFEFNQANGVNLLKSNATSIDKCSFYSNSTSPVDVAAEIRVSAGGSDYNFNISIQENYFFGLANNVAAVYVINSAYGNGVISNNYMTAIGTNTTGIYIGSGDDKAFTVTSNFTQGVTTPYSPVSAQTYIQDTWTPVDGSGAGLTFSAASGSYTKNGNTVFVQASVTYPSTANGSGAVISGMPFVAQKQCVFATISDAGAGYALRTSVGSSGATVYNISTAANPANSTLSGKTLIFSGIYTI